MTFLRPLAPLLQLPIGIQRLLIWTPWLAVIVCAVIVQNRWDSARTSATERILPELQQLCRQNPHCRGVEKTFGLARDRQAPDVQFILHLPHDTPTAARRALIEQASDVLQRSLDHDFGPWRPRLAPASSLQIRYVRV